LATPALAQVRIGIKGGVNFANITFSDNGETSSNNVLPSFNAGAYLDLPLGEGIALQPGLMLEGKGEKINYSSSAVNTDYTIKVNPIYLEVPVNFVGKVPVGKEAHLLLGLGPYAAFGIAGRVKGDGTILGVSTSGSSDIKWDDDTPFNSGDKNQGYDKLKRFDYGANFMAGFELGNVTLTANYGLGLAKVPSGSNNSDDDKYKNRVFGISLGFLLGP
jgi:hypothetical protein